MATNDKIRALVDDFVEQLSAEIHSAALASLEEALRGGATSTPARRGPGRPKLAAAASSRRKPGRKPGRKGRAAKISSEQLLAAIKAHNGERTEVIANDLGVSSKVFKPQLDQMLADGIVVRKGRARGSTLHLK